MTASVLDVISAIDALLPEGVSALVGPEHVGESIAPPRIVWLPVDDSFSPPPNRGASLMRPVWTLESTWECILLFKGDDRTDPTASFRGLEALRDTVLCAVSRIAGGNASIVSGRFDQQDSGAISRFGRSYTLNIRFRLEVVPSASPEALAVIRSAPITGDIVATSQETP